MQILVAYATRKGSTGEIASAIGKELEGEGTPGQGVGKEPSRIIWGMECRVVTKNRQEYNLKHRGESHYGEGRCTRINCRDRLQKRLSGRNQSPAIRSRSFPGTRGDGPGKTSQKKISWLFGMPWRNPQYFPRLTTCPISRTLPGQTRNTTKNPLRPLPLNWTDVGKLGYPVPRNPPRPSPGNEHRRREE